MTGNVVAALVAFAISLISGKWIIPALLRLKIGQTVRDDGPQSHLKKNGTPTMGGVIFLLGFTIAALLFAGKSPYILPIVLLTLGFGLIGFLDDFIKVVLKRSMGLHAWQKMLGQFVITGVFAWYMVNYSGISLEMSLPFTDGMMWNPGALAIPLMFFIILGTVNGTNFTDGLDGLASSVTVVVALFFAAVSVRIGVEITPAMMAMAGALMGFLFYNAYPASVFMGDTGSLALGGLVAGAAYVLQMPLFIVLVGFIYLIEVLSVILQVSYFKLTHGKRIFKMAPIHHHFEKCGYTETKVVTGFTIVTILLCLIAYIAI
ncbi:MAG: phospho-N-acetylmuramoyl-pentapeptide-transferase [Lachnospiraceae bacterium]|nr:phospho-N-acetylmuramoyl-pentapeptide-transferase [Lachnospiraceae bacterium]